MAEIAERIVKELEESEELSFACPTATLDWLKGKIEQALLAQYKLALADALELARNTAGAKTRIVQALRSAAEKDSL